MDMRKSGSSLSMGPLGGELAQLANVAGLAIPALGIVVVDPLMSLLDTACIGRTSSTQLAALVRCILSPHCPPVALGS
jgi:Na+-driven multidrug efflux pump